MIRRGLLAAAAASALFLVPCPSVARGDDSGVYWHIDPGVRTCSMVIDPSLTQSQWHTFTEQIGAISSFKSMRGASALGRGRVQVAVDYADTPVDQHDPAWINTFVHPDADCPLGDAIKMPTVRAAVGVSDRLDAGGIWTMAPRANYGLVGAEMQYAFLHESERVPAVAGRASVVLLTGVPDFSLSMYSLEAITSKRVGRLTPWIGFRSVLAVGTETTSKVDLRAERVPVAQGFAGASYLLWVFDVAAEYDVSSVNTFAFTVGHRF